MGVIRYKDIAYGGGSSVTEGYYKVADGKFYEHYDGTTYSDEITGEDGILYLDLSTNNLYRWSTGASLFVLVGKSTLASLNDTNIATPTDGQAIEYNGTSSKWVNVAKKAADTPTFSEASTRANLSGSGESMVTILGKIKKWFADLKSVAFSGSYSDLTGTPNLSNKYDSTDTLESAQMLINDDRIPFYDSTEGVEKNSKWSNIISSILAYIQPTFLTKQEAGDLAYVNEDGTSSTKYLRGDGTWQAFPTIPTVNDKTLTIQKNGTQVAQFTANSASDVTANITVPTGDLASVNKPSSGQTTSYLRGDGTWQNFPTIPAAQVNSDWNATSGVAQILNKPTIPDDTKVKQTNLTSSSERRVILSSTASSTEATAQVYKSNYLTFNPSTQTLKTSIIQTNDSLEDTAILKPTTDGYGNIGVSNKTFNQGFLRQLFLGRAGSANGGVSFYRSDQSSYYTSLYSEKPTANRALLLPNADGTLATQESTIQYVNLGAIPTQSTTLAIYQYIFNKIPIIAKPVIGRFEYSGHFMFMAYRYGDSGQYGMLVAIPYYIDPVTIFSRNNNTYTLKKFTLTNV